MQSFDHYRLPFLSADRIVRQQEGSQLELHHGERTLVLTVEGGDFEAAWQTLEALRDPVSMHWTELRQQPGNGLLALVDRLDRLGWVGEADLAGRTQVARERDEIRDVMRRCTAWLVEAEGCMNAAGQRVFGHRRYTDGLLQVAKAAAGSAELWADDESDLAGQALSLMLKRWRLTSTTSRQIVHDVFTAAWQRLDTPATAFMPELDSLTLTMIDPLEIGKQVWCAMLLFVLSASDRYRSDYADFVPVGDLAGPGLNILVCAESAAERLMVARGISPLLTLLDHGRDLHRVAVGVYLHQYFITIRYIEAVYTFLQHRLLENLRQASTRYLLEEIGHEEHELAACRELGVADHEVKSFAPLPFFATYPETLAAIAEIDPLAFCLAISVAEGLPGASKPIVSALAERGIAGPSLATHQDIDERLDHALVTRRLMQHIPWVDSETARLAIRRFLFVVDLSQICWSQLADYAETVALPRVPVTLGMSPEQVLRTF